MTVHCLDQSDSPHRRSPPLTSRCLEVRTVVGKAWTHVMDQEVGVRMDDLTGNLRYALQSPGTKGRRVAAVAARGVEQVFAPPGSCIVEFASRRNGKRLSIEGDIPYDVRAHFNMSGAAAALASAGAGLAREKNRGHAHVAIVS